MSRDRSGLQQSGRFTKLGVCLQSLFDQAPRDYTRNCPDGSASNPSPSGILSSVKKPGVSSESAAFN